MPHDAKLLRFASEMRRIPRRALRCDVYGTISAVLDERHARNIFRKVAPLASRSGVADALQALDRRLEWEAGQ